MNYKTKHYDVSLSPIGEQDWDEPMKVLAVNPQHAAESRLEVSASSDDEWLKGGWDAHVTESDEPLKHNWYFRLAQPVKQVIATALFSIPVSELRQQD